MTVKLLTEQHLEFLSLTGGCRGWSESIHFKMPHCWNSHFTAHYQHCHNSWLASCLICHCYQSLNHTVKPVLSSNGRPNLVLKTENRLMQVKSIAECSKHSAILSTFIKIPFVIKIFALSIYFEWPFKTDFTIYSNQFNPEETEPSLMNSLISVHTVSVQIKLNLLSTTAF